MIYAVGDNPVACRLAGVRVWQVLLVVYASCGMLSALAGVLLVGFNHAADLGIAAPFLLPSVAAVVIGGTSILGGVRRLRRDDRRRADPDRARLAADDPRRDAATKQVLYGVIILALAGALRARLRRRLSACPTS